MTYDGFRVERARDIARITLDVPDKLNRVSMLARDQLRVVFEELDADAEVRFVVLGGAGGAFTAGGDIAGFLEEAHALGLVTEIADDLEAAVAGLCDELRRLSPLALAMAKRVLNLAYEGPLHLGLEVEGLAYGLLRGTHDFREGVEAFGAKRPPSFEGR